VHWSLAHIDGGSCVRGKKNCVSGKKGMDVSSELMVHMKQTMGYGVDIRIHEASWAGDPVSHRLFHVYH